MKKIALLALMIMIIGNSIAQRLIYNQKAPEIVVKSVLRGSKLPKGKPIYLDFFSIKSTDNERQLLSLSNLSRSYGEHIYFAIITNDSKQDVEEYFYEYAKTQNINFAVLFDDAGASFKNFNIKFIPNAALIDKKGHFIWQGKSSNIDEYTINQVL